MPLAISEDCSLKPTTVWTCFKPAFEKLARLWRAEQRRIIPDSLTTPILRPAKGQPQRPLRSPPLRPLAPGRAAFLCSNLGSCPSPLQMPDPKLQTCESQTRSLLRDSPTSILTSCCMPRGEACQSSLLYGLFGDGEAATVQHCAARMLWRAYLNSLRSGWVDAAFHRGKRRIAVSYTHLTLPTKA